MDEPVPDMGVAIGAARDNVMGRAQNQAMGRLGFHVEGIPRRSKETRVIDTGKSILQHHRG